MRITIQIQCDGPAFDFKDQHGKELARILRDLADKEESRTRSYTPQHERHLYDSLQCHVGSLIVEDAS